MEGTRAGVLFAGVGRKPFMPRKPLTRCAWGIRSPRRGRGCFSPLPPEDQTRPFGSLPRWRGRAGGRGEARGEAESPKCSAIDDKRPAWRRTRSVGRPICGRSPDNCRRFGAKWSNIAGRDQISAAVSSIVCFFLADVGTSHMVTTKRQRHSGIMRQYGRRNEA